MNIEDKFTLFKILYTIFAVYGTDRISCAYTENLTDPLNLFDYNIGCDCS